MRTALGTTAALAALTLTACGGETTDPVAATEPTPTPASSADPGFEYVDPDAQYASKIAKWVAVADTEKGKYAAGLARDEGWRGDRFALRDVMADTCLNFAKYQDGTYTAFYAWTYVLNDVGRGNTDMPRTKQALVASYFIGAACPELGDASITALEEAFEAAGGL